MKLLGSLTSPYVRKCRVVALELGLPLTMAVTVPLDDGTVLLEANPLGKVPALLLDDGTAIFDSPVIAAYLMSLAPGQALLPKTGPAHWHVLTTEALADGVLDAAIALRIESSHGDAADRNPLWPDRARRAIDRSLAVLAERAGDGAGYAEICTVIACEYLDLRWPAIDWRGSQPRLAALHARMAERPTLAATRPPPGA